MADADSLRVEFLPSLHGIDRESWNRLAGSSSPFLSHEFLITLETTGCTTRASGWQPHHAVVYDAQGQPIAAMPMYLKFNSYGEYVFDWSWADAYRTAGLSYYPKLLSAIPFTPSVGPRLLSADSTPLDALARVLTSAVTTLDETPAVSSWHILFPVEAQAKAFRDQGLLQRFGCQFHWHNRGYASFDEFLAALNSRKRKNIRKERQSVLRKGITFERVDGAQITPDQWRQFYDFYQSTYRIRGMEGYLNLEFFNQVSATMPENVLLIFARKEGEIIAGAMFFRDSSRLYGRYWGCREDFQFLHFETCFYQGIEYCIANGLSHFDAGAQGEHKIQRGFEPELTTSMHWIADTRLRPAIADFLNRERRYIEHYRDEASNYLPFRQTDP